MQNAEREKYMLQSIKHKKHGESEQTWNWNVSLSVD